MRRVAPALTLAGLALGLAACGSGGPVPTAPSASPTAAPTATSEPLPAALTEAALLDAVFRIDVERIEVVFDLYPAERRAQAQAAVTFRMRPGQARPIVHFGPVRSPSGTALRLDGQDLDPARASDVRLFSYDGSGQVSVELQRDLAAGAPHRLEASYPLALADAGGRFFADVNDIEGRGNEAVFPTLNVPHELARHVLVFRVHAAEPYVAVGSGLLTGAIRGRRPGVDARHGARGGVLHGDVPPRPGPHPRPLRAAHPRGGRARPRADRRRHRRGGVRDPRSLARGAPGGARTLSRCRAASTSCSPRAGGGMEYYGATTTSLRALRHEVFHMYFGCSTVARTYRDSWWDEAIDMWYELSADPAYAPIEPGYRSDIVSGRSAVAVGFDRRAYDQGARIMQAVATEMGGRERMVRFLRDLHARRSFDPFTTWDLADEIQAAKRRRRARAVPALAVRLARHPGQRPRHLGLGLAPPGGHGAAGGERSTGEGSPPPGRIRASAPAVRGPRTKDVRAGASGGARNQTENGFHV